jgi:type IV pilus assembly PilO-like protein
MSLSDRDRKIVMFLIPVVVLVGYWFLLLAPKRQEATQLSERLTQQEKKRDEAVGQAQQLETAKANYANDFTTVLRVGKAIPSSVDMPSLIVQLDQAAHGTKIHFKRIKAGARTQAATVSPPAAGGGSASSSSSGGNAPAAAAGGEKAGTGAGKAAEQANNAQQTSESKSQASGAAPTPSGSAPPPSGAAPTPSGPSSGSGAQQGSDAQTSGVPGLDTVPLEFTFTGSFFDLADLFHQLKRFVSTANDRLSVKGRLMTISSFTMKDTGFPTIEADVNAVVYLSPEDEGETAGATPSGPSQNAQPQPASSSSPAPAPQPPTQPSTATPAR